MARYTIGDIEELLFAAFPARDALADDRFGLFVGERKVIVKKIAIALDATVPMVEAAARAGCNLLVTHHPPFWNAPMRFLEAPSPALADGATIYKAAQKQVALLAMHTNLDCAPAAAGMLLEPVGLEYVAALCPNGSGSLGQIARPAAGGGAASSTTASTGKEYLLLGELALAYEQHFGAVAKVWGDADKPLFSVAVCSGAGSDVVPEAIAAGVDCFVTGELRHHEVLWLADANIAVIELGHDNSELPYRHVLHNTLLDAGLPYSDIVILEPSATWWQPATMANESGRAAEAGPRQAN